MMDFDSEIKKIQPINTNNMELKQYVISSAIKRSIILYNTSIAELKTNNLDAAIKDLRKALSYNQSFSEAIKLLGLCYVNKKKFRMAKKTFKKLAKCGIYTNLAEEYVKNLAFERTKSETIYAIGRLNASSTDKKKFMLTKHSVKRIIIGFSILIIIPLCFTLTPWLMSNLPTDSKKVEVFNKAVESGENQGATSEKDQAADEKNTISSEDYRKIEEKLDTAESELDQYMNKYDSVLKLNEAEKSYREGNYEEAANTLLNMKNMSNDDEIKNLHDRLLADINEKALWPIYNQANKLYKEGKYQEALPKLKIVSELDPELDIMPWVIFQIGVCYDETNDNTTALVFFQKVIDNYPKSMYVSYAERKINQLRN